MRPLHSGGPSPIRPSTRKHDTRFLCIDETVTTSNLHDRAEAVAIPHFNYVEQPSLGSSTDC
jgi:hypothetical protein